MVSGGKAARAGRGSGTREAIMAAAERLFAEHGLAAVSNRQIGEAAGQGNVTAVSYHFGSRAGLVRAMTNKHGERIDRIRERYLKEVSGSRDIRDWVGCLVRPVSEYQASLGVPSWHARFSAQVMTDPMQRAIITDESLVRTHLREILDGLGRCLEALPQQVRAERGAMARHLITHTFAEHEQALAEGTGLLHSSWEHAADALTDALVGLLTAPVTTPVDARTDSPTDSRTDVPFDVPH
ncbi:MULTISPECIES: helix-turn-helix domain-containing protein [unclassified Streptomyces]|uniref:TetR/AcrR family transcriptional regulator n=1 Tax=unclassified Streptomyces TaxID=2593676 RepID=UPI002E137471|nr:TetR/AcrR family transcriptional regulator [Streptomyces sp. NBC_01186]WSS40054.1 TetR/AcrR family transcriptional regulator [Streptomyces sp. NBC_01187]